MDLEKLKAELKTFKEVCASKGKPIMESCLKPAYPGDSSTSYILQIQAEWVDDCFDAIDFFVTIMFDTLSEDARKKIFSIQVFKKEDKLHCDTGKKDFASISV